MKLIFEKSKEGKLSSVIPPAAPEQEFPFKSDLPAKYLTAEVPLPELAEPEVIRHYIALSRRNFGVDNGFYPLGSCTMKYNPKIHERVAGFPGFTASHPYLPEERVQGNLELLYELQKFLCAITGMEAFTLQPAAGAHGELTGLMIVRSFFEKKGERRSKVICPDSSHGTNPASVTMCGFQPLPLKSGSDGRVDVAALREVMNEDVAALMLTNPNTLGLFEKEIREIADIVHSKGGLMYCDGANANAILGISRFRDMGYDITHLNLHKTFSTPHGGGGPGAGPVGVSRELAAFLPSPIVVKGAQGYAYYRPENSIGRIKAYNGNFGILLRAYTFIRSLGAEGMAAISRNAVLNANYLRKKLENHFHMEYPGLCKHEFILDDSKMPGGITTLDIAKRLIDFGYHPPTIYFPLIVPGAMMIEPTETETREELDRFAQVMLGILKEAGEQPELCKTAPHNTVVSRMDEVQAARKPVVKREHTG